MRKIKDTIFTCIRSMHAAKLSIISLLLAMLTSGIIMAICGYNPFVAFSAIFVGAFGSQRAIFQTLVQATPLIFTGLAFTFAKKATLINLGIEGQLYMGALGAAVIGSMDLGLPMFLHLPLSLLGGIVLGGLYAGLVGVLKVKFGSNEVIATIMLNSIALFFVDFLVNGSLKAVDSSIPQTEKVLETAMLPRILPKYQLTMAIVIAILTCLLVKYFMNKTVLGYQIRSVGLNKEASETAGISVGKIMLITMFISGGIAGLAGAGHVLGVDRRLINGFSPGYGFDGIAVAALAADNPAAVIFAGIVFGALRAGCMVLSRTTSIPTDFVNIIQALVVIFVAAPLLIKQILNWIPKLPARKEAVKHE